MFSLTQNGTNYRVVFTRDSLLGYRKKKGGRLHFFKEEDLKVEEYDDDISMAVLKETPLALEIKSLLRENPLAIARGTFRRTRCFIKKELDEKNEFGKPKTEIVAEGQIICSPTDNFSYEEGRKKSFTKAVNTFDSKGIRTEFWYQYKREREEHGYVYSDTETKERCKSES